jgi:ATP-dependent helicase/nuclease subunit A
MTDLYDAKARGRILTEFGTNFFVEAAAGTGKTTVMVGRIVGVVRTGAGTLAGTVAVTFTEKAAGELKLRLRLEIEKARADAAGEERNRLDRALEELELARIGTIHAFCGDLLRERPIEAGIDPLFKVASAEEAEVLADEAFERWLQRMLANPPEAVRRVLRRRSVGESPQEQLRDAMRNRCEHRDFSNPWRRDPFDRDRAIDRIIEELAEVGELGTSATWSDDYLTRSLAELATFIEEATRLEDVRGRDYDGLEAELRTFARRRSWQWKGARRTMFPPFSRREVLARRDKVKANLDAFIKATDADLAPLVHESLQGAVAEYESQKAKIGCLDFLDLLIKARNLVRDNANVRRDLQSRFTHFFVDEFQDTDPLQAEILLLLTANNPATSDWRTVGPLPGKLFLVGDPKQSIYRFRRADLVFYEDVKKRVLKAGAQLLHLTTSFRSPPSIQRFVNSAFSSAMISDLEDNAAEYVPLRPSRRESAEQPTIIALPAPMPYDNNGKLSDWRINDSLPDAIAAFIDWLVQESGWRVKERDAIVPIRPRHIAILFRRFRSFRTDITRPYVRALEARRIPQVLVGGRSFYDREEVLALRNAVTAIEWPDDELKVFATLRGPFFALADEALLAYRQCVNGDDKIKMRRLNPVHVVDRATLDELSIPVADGLELLRQLHVGRNHRPIAQTLTMFLDAVRAHAGIALWPSGEQALANCQRLVDMARQFERTASSFRAFVEKVEAEADRGGADEAPVVEEGTEGVRVMTVYKAKGLEFPVVILADPTFKATRDAPSRHVDPTRSLWLEPLCGSAPIELCEAADVEMRREQAEAIRIAYVAATRARDLLILPTCGDKPIEGWFKVLNPVLYPPDGQCRNSKPAPGCPSFGDDSVLRRPPKAHAQQSGSVRPGLHMTGQDAASVVWWDPSVLRLEVEELVPLRHQRILAVDSEGSVAAASEQRYTAWRLERDALLARAARKSLSVQAVTSFARTDAANTSQNGEKGDRIGHIRAGPRIVVEELERSDFERPSGRRFGSLVHSLLASIGLNAGVDEVRALASLNGRLVGATEDETEAAITTVSAALAHPRLRSAALSEGRGCLRRETPVMLRLDDGNLVEGLIDLAFREDTAAFEGWTVLEFKTDREFEISRSQYIAQVALYTKAVAAATASPARGILLVI